MTIFQIIFIYLSSIILVLFSVECPLNVDFIEVILALALYEHSMTFTGNLNLVLTKLCQQTVGFPFTTEMHNNFIYDRFDGIRSTKTWSKSTKMIFYIIKRPVLARDTDYWNLI